MRLSQTASEYLDDLSVHLRIGWRWLVCQAVILFLVTRLDGPDRLRDFLPLIPVFLLTALARAGLLGSLVTLRREGQLPPGGFRGSARGLFWPTVRHGVLVVALSAGLALGVAPVTVTLSQAFDLPGRLLAGLTLAVLYQWIGLYMITYPGYLLARGTPSARVALFAGLEAFWRRKWEAIAVLPIASLFLAPYMLTALLPVWALVFLWLGLLQLIWAPFTTRYWMNRWDAMHEPVDGEAGSVVAF